jgi:hypothetical protein
MMPKSRRRERERTDAVGEVVILGTIRSGLWNYSPALLTVSRDDDNEGSFVTEVVDVRVGDALDRRSAVHGPECPILPVQKCLPECVFILCHLDSRV